MGRLGIAFRAFFGALGSSKTATALAEALSGKPKEPTLPAPKPEPPAPKKPSRSEALTLLEALQRETRLIDLVYESLDGYSDAQIGAAARGVLSGCRGTLNRMFDVAPLAEQAEDSPCEVAPGFEPAKFKLVGAVAGEPPYRGKIVHRGWQARKCELPSWSGKSETALVLAPTEVEV